MKNIRRPRDQRFLLGVCAALANHFSIPVWGVRLIFLLFGVSSVGLAAILYLFLALVIPEESTPSRPFDGGPKVRPSFGQDKQTQRKEVEKVFKDKDE